MRILLAAIVLFLGCSVCAFCENAPIAGKTEGSIYSYSDSDIPEVFFFPKEKARWDGSKVTMREWYMLTDLQKEKFITEYVGEFKKQYQGAIDAVGFDYLKALNLFSFYSNEKVQNEPSTKFIDLLMEGQNRQGGK
jgi:hypothetical protein